MATGFSQFDFHPLIQQAINQEGYTQPTPIQIQAIPVIATGVDVMGAAQTGTGKTAGFTLPILNKLMSFASDSSSPARHPVRVLMLAPTRELAEQIAVKVALYAQFTPLRSCVIYGGVDMTNQVAELRRGVEIVIATPGRLLDHVQQKSIQLNQVNVLVLDEADRMLDMGFLPDLQRIIQLLPKSRQNLLFSATFSPEIQKLAQSFMSHPTLIEVARSNSTSANIHQILYCLSAQSDKLEATCHFILQQALTQVIVFSNTKLGCAKIARQFKNKGISAVAIHGDKTQLERTKALESFKMGEATVLVATDVAARGLDIPHLPYVINYDLPTTAEDYVHRIGRTGRAGAKGTAISFFTKENERVLKEIETLIGQKIPRSELQGFESKSSKSEVPEKKLAVPRHEEKANHRIDSLRREKPLRNTTINLDAEYERLRVKLFTSNKKDEIFSSPYQESDGLSQSQSYSSGVVAQMNSRRDSTSISASSRNRKVSTVAMLFHPLKTTNS